MYLYLKEHWNCTKIFFYSGISKNNTVKIKEYEDLTELGYEMRVKTYSVYKNKDTIIKIICSKCKNERSSMVIIL
jgi:hypothetical protein